MNEHVKVIETVILPQYGTDPYKFTMERAALSAAIAALGQGEAVARAWLRPKDGAVCTAHEKQMALVQDASEYSIPLYTHAPQPVVPDINAMVNRFLCWLLPQDFAPDAGIGFTPPTLPAYWPTGTNLLNATQAKAMFEHCIATKPVKSHADVIEGERWPDYGFNYARGAQ